MDESEKESTIKSSPIFRALISFGVAITLCLAVLAMLWTVQTGQFFSEEKREWGPAQLKGVGAQADLENNKLTLRGLTVDTAEPPYLRPTGRAIVTTGRGEISADKFSHFICDCELSDANADISVFWRKLAAKNTLHRARVDSGFGGTLRPLGDHPDWTGNIMELGLAIEADPDSRAHIQGIELVSDSAWMRFRTLWSSWMVFRPWRGYSINYPYIEAPYKPFPMVPALAVVTSLALLLCSAWTLFRLRRPDSASLLLVLALGWLVLDARWILKLAHQNSETLQALAGLNQAERAALQSDAPLLEFADRVSASIPEGQQRIYLLSDQPENWYLHLRATWHLLPHRVFDFKRRFFQLQEQAEPGDHVLVLAKIPHLEYVDRDGLLLWKGKGKLPAKPVFRSEIGALYRVTESAQ